MPGKKSYAGFLDFVFNVYKGMEAYKMTLAYEGEINHDIIKTFTSLAEGNMSRHEEPENLQKKVYHVLVECLQNIVKHASFLKTINNIEYLKNRGMLLICRNQNEYQITTGNLIEKSTKSYLEGLLNHINALSIDELNQLYKERLKTGQISDKGGAGLGFIDIRRKTGAELTFQFLPISEIHEFFVFTSIIPREA